MAQWLLITSVILLASTLQSMTGFGFAVLAVPLLVRVLPVTALDMAHIIHYTRLPQRMQTGLLL